jgi:hypothetical protein
LPAHSALLRHAFTPDTRRSRHFFNPTTGEQHSFSPSLLFEAITSSRTTKTIHHSSSTSSRLPLPYSNRFRQPALSETSRLPELCRLCCSACMAHPSIHPFIHPSIHSFIHHPSQPLTLSFLPTNTPPCCAARPSASLALLRCGIPPKIRSRASQTTALSLAAIGHSHRFAFPSGNSARSN